MGRTLSVLARPFTSQHEREEGSEEPPPPRNSSKPTGGDLSEGPEGKGHDLPQPAPQSHRPYKQQPPALMGLAEAAIKEHP